MELRSYGARATLVKLQARATGWNCRAGAMGLELWDGDIAIGHGPWGWSGYPKTPTHEELS